MWKGPYKPHPYHPTLSKASGAISILPHQRLNAIPRALDTSTTMSDSESRAIEKSYDAIKICPEITDHEGDAQEKLPTTLSSSELRNFVAPSLISHAITRTMLLKSQCQHPLIQHPSQTY